MVGVYKIFSKFQGYRMKNITCEKLKILIGLFLADLRLLLLLTDLHQLGKNFRIKEICTKLHETADWM